MKTTLKQQAYNSAAEIISVAGLKKSQILIVGCSTSEVLGQRIGTYSSHEAAAEIFDGIYSAAKEKDIFIAVQCCEHLNRALIIEREALPFAEEVNVIPQRKAGGSLATVAYKEFKNPIAIETICADAGIDIGYTMIGMHLKKVAVPVRLKNNHIGESLVLAARTRPPFIGGSRALYDENKM